jgi:putative (di)nucleoside polyphosphate hydrolase
MTVSVSLTQTSGARLPLRPCAGIVLFNADGHVWLGRRRPKWASHPQDYVDGHIWQLPQGGISKGEPPLAAAFRELREETGVSSASLIAEFPGWLSYELPRDLMGVALKGKFAGQKLRWFAMRFTGSDDEIDIAANGGGKPEFDDWRWASLEEMPRLAVTFKRPVYDAVAAEFAAYARPVGAQTVALVGA